MGDASSRRAASILAAALAIALAAAMYLLGADRDERPHRHARPELQKTAASLARDNLSRPYTSSRKATPFWVGAAVR